MTVDQWIEVFKIGLGILGAAGGIVLFSWSVFKFFYPRWKNRKEKQEQEAKEKEAEEQRRLEALKPKPLDVHQLACVYRIEAAARNLAKDLSTVVKEWEESGQIRRLEILNPHLEVMRVNVLEAKSLRIGDNGTDYTVSSIHKAFALLVQEWKDLLEEPKHRDNAAGLGWNRDLSDEYLDEKHAIADSFREKIRVELEALDRMLWAYQDLG